MSNSTVKNPKVQKLDKLSKKRQKKASSEKEKQPVENGTEGGTKVKKPKSEHTSVISDLLTSVPQLGYKELGGGEGLGNGIIINKKKIYIPRQRKIQIYYTLTQTLITTLTPSFTSDSTSILKIELSPKDKALYCLTSDGRLHSWSHPYDKCEGYMSFNKTVLDFQLTQTSLNEDSSYKINLLIRDDTYDNTSELAFKSTDLESKWKTYFTKNQEENEFPAYVVSYDRSKSDKNIQVGTSKSLSDHFNPKEDSINDASFMQTVVKEVNNWNLSSVVRIPRNCIVFNDLRGFPNVLFTFADDIIVLIDTSKSTCATYKHSRSITAIALHPTLPQFAYADTWGKILLNQFSIEEDNLRILSPNCTLHWHSQGVTSLCYLSSGIHLLSGGKESVMVQWNLVEGKTRLLPRLSHTIQSICPYGVKSAAIRCEDGSITVIHDVPDFKELTVFKGIDIPSENSPVIGFDPRTNEIAMVSQNDQLSFIQPKNGQITKTLATTQINKFQQTNSKQVITDPRITQIAFSEDGEWFITSEFWDPVGFPSQSLLKFWHFDTASNTHILTTQIIEPHIGQILHLQLFQHPKAGLVAITLGEDKFVRTWTLSNAEEDEKPQWKCQISHEHPSSNKLLHFDTSSDGTLCALTSSSKIVLWDPLTNNTLTYLAPSLISPQMLQAQFIPNSPYLVIQSATHLSLVNLIYKTQTWKLDLKPQRVLIDKSHGLIHCIVPNTKESARLITLDPVTSEALGFCQIPLLQEGKLPNLIQDSTKYLILKNGKKCSKLYWVDGNRSVFGLNQTKFQIPKNAIISQNVTDLDNEKETSTNKKVNSSIKRTSSGTVKSSYIPDLTPFFEILAAPSHMLPTLKSIFSGLVQVVLPPKQFGSDGIDATIELANNINEDSLIDKNTKESPTLQTSTKPLIQTYKNIDTSLLSVTPTESELNQFLIQKTKLESSSKDISQNGSSEETSINHQKSLKKTKTK